MLDENSHTCSRGLAAIATLMVLLSAFINYTAFVLQPAAAQAVNNMQDGPSTLIANEIVDIPAEGVVWFVVPVDPSPGPRLMGSWEEQFGRPVLIQLYEGPPGCDLSTYPGDWHDCFDVNNIVYSTFGTVEDQSSGTVSWSLIPGQQYTLLIESSSALDDVQVSLNFELVYGQGGSGSPGGSPSALPPPPQSPPIQEQPQPQPQLPGSGSGGFEDPRNTVSSEFLTHQDQDLLFSISYPPHWQLTKNEQSVIFTNAPQMAQFSISVLEITEGSPDPAALVINGVNKLLSSASERMQGFGLVSLGDPYVAPSFIGNSNDGSSSSSNQPIGINFIYDFQRDGIPFRSLNTLISAGPILYRISFIAPTATIQDVNQGVIQDAIQMTSTFQIDPSVLTLGEDLSNQRRVLTN
jgi:hypothetical protein